MKLSKSRKKTVLSISDTFKIFWIMACKKNMFPISLLLEKEFRFFPKRRWRFDFAIPEIKVAIEIEGGVYTNGRHTRGLGYEKDCEKYNTAILEGWKVFRITSNLCNNSTVQSIVDYCYSLKESYEKSIVC